MSDQSKPSSHNAQRIPFLAFTTDNAGATVLKQFAIAQGWPEAVVHTGDIKTAAAFLQSNPSPKVLCVDVTSVEAASAELDALADVCDPGVKVIVSGTINEYSFYAWLVEMGISNYLLKPFTMATLEAAYRKTFDVAPAASVAAAVEVKKDAKVISVIGARGGVGASTVAVNLAWILAHALGQKTALLDFDPQLGTVALALDLEPGKGLRDALEKPDRIDGLFLDRVMVRLEDNLSVLSTEEGLDESIAPSEAAAEALLKQSKPKFSHIVVDVPRSLTPFTRHALKHANHVICVTEFTIMGLRESLRYLEFCRDYLKVGVPIFVANRVGLAGKHQMPQAEFEKGLGVKISYSIPFVLDAHAAATAGEVLVETAKNAPATKILHALAGHFAEQKDAVAASKPKGLLALLKGSK
jgi:pilus assembly protein CpaE